MSALTVVHDVPATVAGTQRGPELEPAVLAFLGRVDALPPIAELDVAGVRRVMEVLQTPTARPLPAVVVDERRVDLAGPLGEIAFRIVRPSDVSGALPVILYIHGGGWVAGGIRSHDRLVRELAVGTRAAVVFPRYSRSPEVAYPRAIRESYAVLSWIARHGAKHQLDGSRIAVAGDSVGATIATTLALLARERSGPRLAAQALFYPATDAVFDTESYRQFGTGYWLRSDSMRWFWDQYAPDESLRAEVTASPLRASLNELARLAPAFVATAEADVLRDEGEAYARRLSDAGVEVVARRYRGVVHDFMSLNQLRETDAAEAAISDAVAYLRTALAQRPSERRYRIGW